VVDAGMLIEPATSDLGRTMRMARQTCSGGAGCGESSGLLQLGRVLWIEGRTRCGQRGGVEEAGLDGVVTADYDRRTVLHGRWPSDDLAVM
jgi:hypothetical protein